MTKSENPFDVHLSSWKAEQDQPWMNLRYRLEYRNIRRYVGEHELSALDAGGGNAASAIQFAREGHLVTVVDSSEAMLTDGREAAQKAGLDERMKFHQAELVDLPTLFPEPSFDLVLCHNVIQYVEEVDRNLRALVQSLHSNGILSLMTINGYYEVYKVAFRELDLEKAIFQLDTDKTRATLFDVSMRSFSETELIEMLERAGCITLGLYGVRCLCDWLPNEPKYNPEFLRKLEELEYRLADRYPYYLLARFYQVIGRK